MPEVRITLLRDAFRTAFGITPRRFSLPERQKFGPISDYKDGIEMLESDTPVALKSLLSTPLLDQLKVAAGVTPKGTAYDAYTFAVDPLLEVSRKKNIVETKIAGRDGTVIELIGKENWQVKIRGLLVGKKGKYPKDDVAALAHICDLDTSFEVSSGFLNLFEITNLVITDYSFPELQGFPDTQPYEISAVADLALELQFEETNANSRG